MTAHTALTPSGAAQDAATRRTRLDADVVLRDGTTIHVRSVRPDDESRISDFLGQLSEASLAQRFCGGLSDYALAEQARRFAQGGDATGLVATVGHDQRIVAHAAYFATAPGRAEVAFTIADEYQGHGLGTILLGELAQMGATGGVRIFEATTLPGNAAMVSVCRDSGFPTRIVARRGDVRIEFPTELTQGALERFEQRDGNAAVNAVRSFLCPTSVAVIGASRKRGTIGGAILHNLLDYGFEGPVLPVNTNAGVVQSIVARSSVEEIPGAVDLAVIAVPAEHVLDVAEACGRKGVRSLVVISAGFAEQDGDGRRRQQALMNVCRETGMRLIGPNCMGIVNTDARVRLNATFAPVAPSAGPVGFMSQSGALGLAVMDYSSRFGLGLSSFVSVGNKADISGNDLLCYWEQDPSTHLILLYLESFGNPRKFSRIARRVARKKPIVAVKSGRTPAGARAVGSHTGAMLAGSDVTIDALFRAAGVIRTDTLSDMFDVASLLATQPLPKGRRVAILTNAGGPGILCADACEAEGLEIPSFDESTTAALRASLPPEASVRNPVDMIASATAEQYRGAMGALAADPSVDALIVIFIPPLVTKAADVARAIVDGVRVLEGRKPVVSVFMQSQGVPDELRASDVQIPSYAFPEDAALALSRVARYAAWRTQPTEPPAHHADIRRDEAAGSITAALARGGGWLTADETSRLLVAYGLPVLAQRLVTTREEVEGAASALGARVAVKAVVRGLVHKTEAGAVRLGLNPQQAAAAAAEMAERLSGAGHIVDGYLVQRMADEGIEMIVGVVHDPSFGPVLACGAGGTLVELLKDVSVRLAPLASSAARDMVRELRSYPLFTGYRGAPTRDEAALVDVITRVGEMVEDLPQIAELDLNPIIVHANGATIVDARVRAEPAAMLPPLGARG